MTKQREGLGSSYKLFVLFLVSSFAPLVTLSARFFLLPSIFHSFFFVYDNFQLHSVLDFSPSKESHLIGP